MPERRCPPGKLSFALPGDPDTRTGGYIYDARIIAGLRARGWDVEILLLGDGFPFPSLATRECAQHILLEAARQGCVIVDGLALGVLPNAARLVAETSSLVALIHHPLALESGLPAAVETTFALSERQALAYARHVIVTSEATAAILNADYAVPPDRISIAEPGVEAAAFSTGSGGTGVALLSVGAIGERKGFDLLIEALARSADLYWHLTIVGDTMRAPDCVSRLRCGIEALGLADRVTLTGTVTPGTLETLYQHADAFVSASHFEGYGMAYAEAIAHGLPVIGTRVGAAADLVPNGAGILTPPGDVDALAKALRRLIADPSLRSGMAAGARAAAANLPSWEQALHRFEAVLSAMEGSGR